MLPDESIEEKLRDFLASSSFMTAKTIKDRTVIKDIRSFVEDLQFDRVNHVISLRIGWLNNGTLNPLDFLREVIGIGEADLIETRITKTETFFREP